MTTQLKEILNWSVAERLLLVEAVWNSIAEEPESLQLSDAQIAELNRRKARLANGESKLRSWDEVKQRLLDKQ